MEKEPKELVEARAWLRKSEEDLGDPQRLPYIQRGISLLIDVIAGNHPQVLKERAKNLAVTYRNRILAEVKVILSNADSCELDSLEHWQKLMEVFADAAYDDAQDFKACKEDLWSVWAKRFLGSLKPWELDILKREFQKKTSPKGE